MILQKVIRVAIQRADFTARSFDRERLNMASILADTTVFAY